MISNTLLSLIEKCTITDIQIVDGDIYYNRMTGMFANVSTAFGDFEGMVNIHELAHKCKEWATKQTIISDKGRDNNLPLTLYIKSTTRPYGYCDAEIYGTALAAHWKIELDEDICEDSEPEAIFKACEWILNEHL